MIFDGSVIGLISYLALSVIGDGVAEEILNRGFFVTILRGAFSNHRLGLWISGAISVLFFSPGHLPDPPIMWCDILVPNVADTLLFVCTGRLLAPIAAHASYNATAILCVDGLSAGKSVAPALALR